MKPIYLKEIARGYTDKFYPQYLSRVDRIWDMIESMPPNIKPSEYQCGDGFSFASGAEESFDDFISGIAVFVFTYKNIKDENKITKENLKETIETNLLKLKLTKSINDKIKNLLKEVIPSSVSKLNGFINGKKVEYKVWYKNSEPGGIELTKEAKEELVKNDLDKYILFIIREDNLTHTYIKEKLTNNPPGKVAYRILSYVLKNKGKGGTAWNLARYLYDVREAVKFKDIRELQKIIKQKSGLYKDNIEERLEKPGDNVKYFSDRVGQRINELNIKFLKKLKIKLEADAMGEYKLNKSLRYCLIEKIFDL